MSTSYVNQISTAPITRNVSTANASANKDSWPEEPLVSTSTNAQLNHVDLIQLALTLLADLGVTVRMDTWVLHPECNVRHLAKTSNVDFTLIANLTDKKPIAFAKTGGRLIQVILLLDVSVSLFQQKNIITCNLNDLNIYLNLLQILTNAIKATDLTVVAVHTPSARILLEVTVVSVLRDTKEMPIPSVSISMNVLYQIVVVVVLSVIIFKDLTLANVLKELFLTQIQR